MIVTGERHSDIVHHSAEDDIYTGGVSIRLSTHGGYEFTGWSTEVVPFNRSNIENDTKIDRDQLRKLGYLE